MEDTSVAQATIGECQTFQSPEKNQRRSASAITNYASASPSMPADLRTSTPNCRRSPSILSPSPRRRSPRFLEEKNKVGPKPPARRALMSGRCETNHSQDPAEVFHNAQETQLVWPGTSAPADAMGSSKYIILYVDEKKWISSWLKFSGTFQSQFIYQSNQLLSIHCGKYGGCRIFEQIQSKKSHCALHHIIAIHTEFPFCEMTNNGGFIGSFEWFLEMCSPAHFGVCTMLMWQAWTNNFPFYSSPTHSAGAVASHQGFPDVSILGATGYEVINGEEYEDVWNIVSCATTSIPIIWNFLKEATKRIRNVMASCGQLLEWFFVQLSEKIYIIAINSFSLENGEAIVIFNTSIITNANLE